MPTVSEPRPPPYEEPHTERGHGPIGEELRCRGFDEGPMRATIQDMQMRSPLGEDPPTQPSVQPVSDLPNVPVVRFSRTTPPPIAEARNVATKPGIAPVKALTAARADSARKRARATSPPIGRIDRRARHEIESHVGSTYSARSSSPAAS